MLLLITGSLYSQTKNITGKITDAAGQVIPGATIRLKAYSGATGTSSDANGQFSIRGPQNSVLLISAVGYDQREVKTGGSSFLSIQLSQDAKSLAEVVVTGVGVATSKKKLGMAVESIGSENLPEVPTASIDQALVGKIPGAQISSVNGSPGAPVNILLRGINTIQGGTSPMILIDGVQMGATSLQMIDLSNIDRVEVIQGAAAGTIYGAQGANGVIQLFTKKGKMGAVAINYATSYGVNSLINSGHVHKARLHSFSTDANNNILDPSTGLPAVFGPDGTTNVAWAYSGAQWPSAMADPRNIADKLYNANFKYYDHFRQVFGNGYALNNSISLSGASQKSDFALTVSNNHTTDIVRGNGYNDRTNLTANMGTELAKGFRLRSVTELVYTKNTLNPAMYSGSSGLGSILGRFMNASPFVDLRHTLADGTYPIYITAGTVSANAVNPFYMEEYSKGINHNLDIIQNLDANLKVTRFVELDAKYGINYTMNHSRNTYYNQSENINAINTGWFLANYAPDNTGEIDDYSSSAVFQNFLASAFIKTDFQRDFQSRLPIQTSTQLSFDYRNSMSNQYYTYGVGLPTVPPYNIASTNNIGLSTDYTSPFVTYGYLVNQKIDLGNYAGVSGGFRTDYSSVFGGSHKPFTFPRADGYFAPSALNFWQDHKIGTLLPYFKVRAAYGEAGIQPNVFQNILALNSGHLGNALSYSTPGTVRNPDLQVETSKEFEAGTDFSIAFSKGGRWLSGLDASFSYWTRKTDNAIYAVSVPLSTGSTTEYENAIGLSSHGYQFQLNLPVLKSESFTWNFTTNFSHQTSVINSINGAANIILATSGGNTALSLSPGSKIGQIYGKKAFRSLDQKRQDGTSYIDKADYGKYEMVDGRVVDTATKGIQFTNESYSFGDPNPKFNVSFINSFTYKSFLSFAFQFDWIYGSHLYNQTNEWMYRDGISGDFDKPVTINGQHAAYTAYYRSAYSDMWGSQNGDRDGTHDYYYEGASFLRLRNVSIGLDFARLYNIKYFKKLQLVFTGRNILTVTKYSGFDPEISSGGSNSSYDRGVDQYSMPNNKTYAIGLNVGL